MLTLCEWCCADTVVLEASDLCERLRAIEAEVGGLGEGMNDTGVAIDGFLGVKPECGRPAVGVAMAVCQSQIDPVKSRFRPGLGKSQICFFLQLQGFLIGCSWGSSGINGSLWTADPSTMRVGARMIRKARMESSQRSARDQHSAHGKDSIIFGSGLQTRITFSRQLYN